MSYARSLQYFAGKRQTLLFSATQTRNVEDLARVSLKKEPMYIGVDDNKVRMKRISLILGILD